MRKAKKAVRKAAEARKKKKGVKPASPDSGDNPAINAGQPLVLVADYQLHERPSGILVPITVSSVKATVPDVPRYLFQYAPPNMARIWDALVEGLVHFASPVNFNDPYDSRHFPVKSREEWKALFRRTDREIEKYQKAGGDVSALNTGEEKEKYRDALLADPDAIKKMADRMARAGNMGVRCLSAKCNSVPMWAHYAKDHCGVCFVFNLSNYSVGAGLEAGSGRFPFSLVWEVKYSKRMPAGRLGEDGFPPRRFVTKSNEWAYEQEWRAFMPDQSCVAPLSGKRLPSTMSAFKGVGDYHHNGALVGVIMGIRTSEAMRRRIQKAVWACNLGLWQADISPGKYGFAIEPCNEKAQRENLR